MTASFQGIPLDEISDEGSELLEFAYQHTLKMFALILFHYSRGTVL